MPASLLLSLTLSAQSLLADPPQTLTAAKQIARQLYASRPTTFYCGCRFNGNEIDLDSCGYQPRKQAQRAARLEWEHVVPAWVIGHQRTCWQRGGRDYCTRHDRDYQAAEADLHNLVPSIGEVNSDRSNFALGMLNQKPHQYGACPMVVNFSAKTAMPPETARGPAARIYLYMAERYKLRLSKQDRRTYEAWDKQYPVTEWERWRNQYVGCVMGHGNPYIGEVDTLQCLLQKVLSAR